MSVFISHSSKDDGIVAEIRRELEGLGIETRTDSQHLKPGDELTPTIVRAIERSTHFIAILSVNAINSPWVAKEIKQALTFKKEVIPVMLPGIEPSSLPLWFDEEPLGLKLAIGPGGVSAALPSLLAALGEQLPVDPAAAHQPEAAPVADLILKLTDPAIHTAEGKWRATAIATLTYDPADGRSV